ncbi:MAG TPA: cell wall-active antibiotics response protein LiaF [Anaerolineae bacterium]
MRRWDSSQVFFALVLIVVGALLLVGNLGLFALDWNLFWPIILILFGIWLVSRAFAQSADYGGSFSSWGFGEYAPNLSGKEIRHETFSHGFGDFDLDLTRAIIPAGESFVRASHGFGDLTVIVPRTLSLRVHASAGMGDVSLFGEESGGVAPSRSFLAEDYATAATKLTLDASVGFGEVKVIRSQ